jgi:hypothetical protein
VSEASRHVRIPRPPLSPEVRKTRAEYEAAFADGTIDAKVRPIREQLSDIFEESKDS